MAKFKNLFEAKGDYNINATIVNLLERGDLNDDDLIQLIAFMCNNSRLEWVGKSASEIRESKRFIFDLKKRYNVGLLANSKDRSEVTSIIENLNKLREDINNDIFNNVISIDVENDDEDDDSEAFLDGIEISNKKQIELEEILKNRPELHIEGTIRKFINTTITNYIQDNKTLNAGFFSLNSLKSLIRNNKKYKFNFEKYDEYIVEILKAKHYTFSENEKLGTMIYVPNYMSRYNKGIFKG